MAHGSTIVSEDGNSWKFDVSLSGRDNGFWNTITGNNLHLAGYKGTISRFDKPSVVEWLNRDNQVNSARVQKSLSPVIFDSNTPNILILGGYGLFGSRIACSLLIEPLANKGNVPIIHLNSRSPHKNVH